MDFLFYVLAGIGGGVLGGMGMGGGTILIPLLCIFLNVNQHLAQGVNLIAFLPMSVIALIIHAKNGILNSKGVLLIIIPAIITGFLSSLLAFNISSNVLQKMFGGFLIVFSFVEFILGYKKQKNQNKGKNSLSCSKNYSQKSFKFNGIFWRFWKNCINNR